VANPRGRPRSTIPKDLLLTEDNPYTRLNFKAKRLVEAKLQGLSNAAAGRVAGVDQPNVTVMLRNPKVMAAIRYLVRESTKSVEDLTKSDVLTGMMDAVNAAATAAELVMAWREVGKLLGHYEPERKILEIHDYSKEELRELSDADLLRLAGGTIKEVIDDAEYVELDSEG